MLLTPGRKHIIEVGVELGSQLKGPEIEPIGWRAATTAGGQAKGSGTEQQLPSRHRPVHDVPLLRHSNNCIDTSIGASSAVTRV